MKKKLPLAYLVVVRVKIMRHELSVTCVVDHGSRCRRLSPRWRWDKHKGSRHQRIWRGDELRNRKKGSTTVRLKDTQTLTHAEGLRYWPANRSSNRRIRN